MRDTFLLIFIYIYIYIYTHTLLSQKAHLRKVQEAFIATTTAHLVNQTWHLQSTTLKSFLSQYPTNAPDY
jgi:uncharacterized membrane protein